MCTKYFVLFLVNLRRVGINGTLIYADPVSTGQNPEDWKFAHGVPIEKCDSSKNINRIKSLILCKILDYISYTQLKVHIKYFFMMEQHSFCKRSFCTTQVLNFYHDLISKVKRGGGQNGLQFFSFL